MTTLPHLELREPQETIAQFKTLANSLDSGTDLLKDEVIRAIEQLCQRYALGHLSSESLLINYQVLVQRSNDRDDRELHHMNVDWRGQNFDWIK
eukprot:4660842-Pleurochrysis_carterae.AAC.1